MGKYTQHIESFVNSKVANLTLKQISAYNNLTHRVKPGEIPANFETSIKPKNIENRKIIYRYDLDGNFMSEYESITAFRKSLTSNTYITENTILKRKIIQGTILKFEKYDKLPDDILSYHLSSLRSTKKTGLNFGN